ncbi:HAD-IA family hydrolase, partial [Enterococcus cecorum]|nr:HAD-IA family hydrolase [Enterococcus cecorum]
EKVIEKGGKNYLLTHRENASAKALLQGSQLDGLFVEIVGPENKFPRKPDPTSLLYLVEKYQMDKTKTVMIGDRPMDIDAGINAGVQSIFYNDERLFKIKQAHHEVHSLTEIEKFLGE